RRNREVGQGDQVRRHQAGVIPKFRPIFHNCRFANRGALMSANRHCAVIGRTVSLKTASRPSEGFGREYFFSTFQSAPGILEPSRTVLDATATKWSLDVAQTTSRLDYQKMETMAESARRVGSLSPSLT